MASCLICFEEDLTEIGELNCCDHRFCFPCILSWSERKNRCPYCRSRFTVVRRRQFLQALLQCDEEAVVDRHPGQILEEVQVAERDPADGDVIYDDMPGLLHLDICQECDEMVCEDEWLLCKGCDRGWHPSCLGLQAVPEGEWNCANCSNRTRPSSQAWVG